MRIHFLEVWRRCYGGRSRDGRWLLGSKVVPIVLAHKINSLFLSKTTTVNAMKISKRREKNE